MFDVKIMQVAYEASLKGRGFTMSNPVVGACVVRGGEVLGVGFHESFGGNHAEVNAVINSGLEDFSDCVLYTTLEPCCVEGKTGACTKMIIEKGFKKVCVGVLDVNEKVSGKGVTFLRDNGVDVVVMEESEQLFEKIKFSLRKYEYFVRTGLPYVTMKAGVSLDGKIADKEGFSKWITDEKCRMDSRRERSFCDAVLVGSGTVKADDCGLAGALRIVIDKDLSLSLYRSVFRDENVLVVTTKLGEGRMEDFKDFDVLLLGKERVDIALLLKELGKRAISSLFVEGGAGIHGAFNDAGLVQEYLFYYSPIVLGGDGLNVVGGDGVLLNDASRFKVVESKVIGDGVRVRCVLD